MSLAVFRFAAVILGLAMAFPFSVAAAGESPWPAGLDEQVQEVEMAFFNAMNSAVTTEEMLAAATNRYNGLAKILESVRAGAHAEMANDPSGAFALEAVDLSLNQLTQAVMDKEMRRGGSLAPVAATIAGGNVLSAQVSLYLGLLGGGEG